MWASTLWPFSSSTRNMAFGNGSTTVPSTRIVSSFGFAMVPTTSGGGSDATRGARRTRFERTQGRPTILAELREGQHFRPVVGAGDGVLEVGGATPVPGHDRP